MGRPTIHYSPWSHKAKAGASECATPAWKQRGLLIGLYLPGFMENGLRRPPDLWKSKLHHYPGDECLAKPQGSTVVELCPGKVFRRT